MLMHMNYMRICLLLVALKLSLFVFVTSCDEIGKILGHLPTQQITAVDENAFSMLMM